MRGFLGTVLVNLGVPGIWGFDYLVRVIILVEPGL